jgi:chemotaxis protein histidine kinase CheA
MAETNHDKPGVTKYADHEVIVVPNRLKKKAMRHAAADEPDPLADAEIALQELSGQFSSWMEDECRALEEARQLVHRHGLTEETRQALFRAAHDIKGHGATFGYPLASDVADNLCRMIEHADATAPIPPTYIDQCVDSVRAIIREHADKNAEQIAAALASELRTLTDELLGVNEAGEAAEPAGTSPPLAPA